MNYKAKLEAKGTSSVAGIHWFFVNLAGQLYVAIHDYTVDEAPNAWQVRLYSPSQDFDCGRVLTGPATETIIEACLSKDTEISINWNDKARSTELHWKVKKQETEPRPDLSRDNASDTPNGRTMIKEYIQGLLDRHVAGTPHRFCELWNLVPDLGRHLRQEVERQKSWVYLSPQTYDGWYLLKTDKGYDLYYQEKGQNCWGTRHFEDEKAAMMAFMEKATGLTLQPHSDREDSHNRHPRALT